MTGYMFYRFMFESMGVSTVGPDLSRAVHVPSIASIGALADVISSVSSKPSDSRSSHNLPGCRKAPVSSRRVPLGGFSQMTEMTGTLLWHSQTAAKRSLNNSRHLTTATWKKKQEGRTTYLMTRYPPGWGGGEGMTEACQTQNSPMLFGYEPRYRWMPALSLSQMSANESAGLQETDKGPMRAMRLLLSPRGETDLIVQCQINLLKLKSFTDNPFYPEPRTLDISLRCKSENKYK